MTKHEGYQCDGGCGANLVLKPTDMTTRHGWFRTFTPDGLPTFDTCSAVCLVRCLEQHGLRGTVTLPKGEHSG